MANWHVRINDKSDCEMKLRPWIANSTLRHSQIALIVAEDDAEVEEYNVLVRKNAPNICIFYIVKPNQQFEKININSDNVVIFDECRPKEDFYKELTSKFINLSQAKLDSVKRPALV